MLADTLRQTHICMRVCVCVCVRVRAHIHMHSGSKRGHPFQRRGVLKLSGSASVLIPLSTFLLCRQKVVLVV